MDLRKTVKNISLGIWDDIAEILHAALRLRKINRPLFDILVILFVAVTMFSSSVPFLSRNRMDARLYKVEIPEGASASRVTDILYSSGIIQSRLSFKIYVNLFSHGPKLKAGSYYLSPSMSNAVIAAKLVRGISSAGNIRVMIPEGSSIYRMTKIMEQSGITVSGGDFAELVNGGLTRDRRLRHPFLSEVPTRSLEGYLFPDTYFLPSSIALPELIDIMLDRFAEIVLPVYVASDTKYSLHEIITLASIVEKEAENDNERAVIASVFWNRLKNGIALRADPTVKYALDNPSKRVTFADLKVDSPYNTYLYKGLPPGPICNPGIASIYAVLHPARTNYFYFVSNGDGTHTFSETWEKHKNAADRFRRK